MIEEFLNL